MGRKFILGLDFDGTLCERDYPNIGEPKVDFIEAIKVVQSKYDIETVLITCRHGGYDIEAVEWCLAQGIQIDRVNENSAEGIERFGDSRKVFADVYFDDRSYAYTSFLAYFSEHSSYKDTCRDVSIIIDRSMVQNMELLYNILMDMGYKQRDGKGDYIEC